MTLTRTTGAAAAAVLVAATVIGTAGEAAADHSTKIKVTEINTGYDQSFDDDEMPERGDSFSFTSNLKQNGKKVGTDKGKCTFKRFLTEGTEIVGAVTKCKVMLTFKKGTIKVAGTVQLQFDEPAVFTIPITGGTGKYEGASGTLKNVEVSENKSKLTLKVTHD